MRESRGRDEAFHSFAVTMKQTSIPPSSPWTPRGKTRKMPSHRRLRIEPGDQTHAMGTGKST